MSLIKCPECSREISDKAETCPGCGVKLGVSNKNGKRSASVFAEISWVVFVIELVSIAGATAYIASESAGGINGYLFRFAVFWRLFGWIFFLVSLVGILFAVASLARKEPKNVLAWVCLVLHGVSLIGK
ncbi:zinc ribbon domain-containing protein [Solidesulfovibrio carbinoliphilus]|uniref:zinc ribbon domain-containing protein n=1 Tax=Solidesulfovibrio carbinoliphilus TaxID=345370 RepID=UPI0012F4D6FE|nr:zinc ribbon domain-containing protein [Solidesulfovibrio carbinoliphilus]